MKRIGRNELSAATAVDYADPGKHSSRQSELFRGVQCGLELDDESISALIRFFELLAEWDREQPKDAQT